MQRQDAIDITRRLWAWLAEDGTRRKQYWPELKSNGGTVKNMVSDCACCTYVEFVEDILESAANPHAVMYTLQNKYGINFLCELFCPLEWPNKEGCNVSGVGLFDRWESARQEGRFEEAKGLAAEIAKLPAKKNNK